MSISVHCGCGATLKCPEKLAGKRARCGWCKRELFIPAPGGPAGRPDVPVRPRHEPVDAARVPSCAAAGGNGLHRGSLDRATVCGVATSLAPGYVACPGCHRPVPPVPLRNCPHCGEDLNAKPEQAARHKSRRAPQWRAVTGGLELIVSGGRILAAAMLCCSGLFLAFALTPALGLGPGGVLLSLAVVTIALAGGFWFQSACDDELLVRAYGLGLAWPVLLVIGAVTAPAVVALMTIVGVVAVVVAALVAVVKMLLGSCRCLSMPQQVGGRHCLGLAIGIAIASPFVPMVVLLAATVISGKPATFSPGPWLAALLAAIPNTLFAGAMLLFLNFLRGVSSFFDDEPTTDYIDGCAAWFSIWAVVYVLISAATAGLAAAHDAWVVLGFSGMTCCWLLGAIWFLRFLATVSAVSDGISRTR